MQENQSYYGSIDFSTLIEEAKKQNPAFLRAGKQNRIFANVQVWVSKEPDKYGNSLSIQLQYVAGQDKIYIGNLKKSEKKIKSLDNTSDVPDEDDLHF